MEGIYGRSGERWADRLERHEVAKKEGQALNKARLWVEQGLKEGYLDIDRGLLFLTGAAGPSHEDHLNEDGEWDQGAV